MLTRRIIACLDVRDGVVVKGTRFRNHRVLGDILELARRYRDQGADELVFYDITASVEDRMVSLDWIDRTARLLDIPFAVAGGIRSVRDAERVLNAGADKVSVNSPALERPELITELANEFGSQAVVVGIDSRRSDSGFVVYMYTGRASSTTPARRDTLDWAREAMERGAGEIVLNCMSSDGVGRGYDLEQTAAVRERVTVPLVASGGAGSPEHFLDVFRATKADAALAAGVFHRGELSVGEVKEHLHSHGIAVRR